MPVNKFLKKKLLIFAYFFFVIVVRMMIGMSDEYPLILYITENLRILV